MKRLAETRDAAIKLRVYLYRQVTQASGLSLGRMHGILAND
jgi:hypothetical protein